MVDAAADTLHKAWRAGINLEARADDHPRLLSIARLEEAVLAQTASMHDAPARPRNCRFVATQLR